MQLENNILQRQLLKWIGDANNHELAQIIIEKIIESGDRFKQTEIIDYLFRAALDERHEKRKQILYLLNELYSCNILPLKYYDQYYMTILLSGGVLYDIMRGTRRTGRGAIIKYDEQELASIYCRYVGDIDSFIDTVESLLFLNTQFRDGIIDNFYDSNLIKNTLTLFSLSKYSDARRREANNENVKEALKYFANQRFDLLKRSPIIFVFWVHAIFSLGLQEDMMLEKIIFNDVQANNYYYKYSSPRVLIDLITVSIRNNTVFALLLQLMILYSTSGTNTMIGYVLKTAPFKENSPEVVDFMYWLWQSFNISEKYIDFENRLKERELYDPMYDGVYGKAYELYRSNEMDLQDDRIIAFFEERCKED